MKTKLAISLLSMAAGSTAIAGYTFHPEVNVNKSARYTYGSLVGAKNSADNTQYIGCSTAGLSNPYSICTARDSAGNTVICTTQSAEHAEQIAGLSSQAYLYFRWKEDGTCDYIYSATGSQYTE